MSVRSIRTSAPTIGSLVSALTTSPSSRPVCAAATSDESAIIAQHANADIRCLIFISILRLVLKLLEALTTIFQAVADAESAGVSAWEISPAFAHRAHYQIQRSYASGYEVVLRE